MSAYLISDLLSCSQVTTTCAFIPWLILYFFCQVTTAPFLPMARLDQGSRTPWWAMGKTGKLFGICTLPFESEHSKSRMSLLAPLTL